MRVTLVVLGIVAAIALVVPSVLAQGSDDNYLPLLYGGGSPGPTGTTSATADPTGSPTVTGTTTVEPTGSPTVTGTTTVEPTGSPTATGTTTVEPTGSPTVTGTTTVEPTGSPTATGTITAEPTGSPTATGTITVEPTETAEPTETVELTETPTTTPTATGTVVGPTPTNTPTATATATLEGPTPTNTPTGTPTTTACQVAPEDPRFLNPLILPLNVSASRLDFVSYEGGDREDRIAYEVSGMNSNPSLPGGRARLVISASCFGTNTDEIEFFTGGNTFECGETLVDREVTADSDTGSIIITATGGECTYVQWVINGTAFPID